MKGNFSVMARQVAAKAVCDSDRFRSGSSAGRGGRAGWELG